MRNGKLFFLSLILVLMFVSCNQKSSNKVQVSTREEVVSTGDGHTFTLDSVNSVITWKGFKVGGEHYGTLRLIEGIATIDNGHMDSGRFLIDMNSIVVDDITNVDTNKKLLDHLKGSDFFDVEQFPISKFELTGAGDLQSDSICQISGNLTLKGVTRNITFKAKISFDGVSYKGTTDPFVINRTEWGVNYGSETVFDKLKDNVISDNIELKIIIVLNPVL